MKDKPQAGDPALHRRSRDERGWIIPRNGTKKRMVYELMREDAPSDDVIAVYVGCSRQMLAVYRHQIRNPDYHNRTNLTGYRRRKAAA